MGDDTAAEGSAMDKAFIGDEIAKAMRAQDKPRVAILRLVKNEIDVKEKAEKRELSDEEVTGAFKKVLKQTGETLEGSIKAATNEERTMLLQTQADILSAYLPKQVCGAELEGVVERVIAEGGFAEKRDMGKVIGLVVSETEGNCDKAQVARIVGSKLA